VSEERQSTDPTRKALTRLLGNEGKALAGRRTLL
jgi:hypothetical protein